MDHEIFRTPHAVALTLEDRSTPTSYANYPEGRALGATMPMWRVQTEGYSEGTGQLVGLVSRDAGFFDSPDVEWISGGVNSKGPNAIAIGRHGNFFHWGFAASPTYLTEEGRLVLVNALHYIARFDRQVPVARKKPGVSARSSVANDIESMTEAGHARMLEVYARFRAEMERQKLALQARIDAGEAVADHERQMLTMPPLEDPDRLQSARRYLSEEVLARLGEPDAIVQYLRESLPYMYWQGGWYELAMDEELRPLGIANDDPLLLTRALELLGSDETAPLGRSLLRRYTEESFDTADEWTAWLTRHEGALFFSEVAGYKWLVNTRAGATGTRRAPVELKPTGDAPLAARLSLASSTEGGHQLTVQVSILAGWHAYDAVGPGSAYLPLTLELDLPEGVRRVGDWQRPVGRLDPLTPGVSVFVDRIDFRCRLETADTEQLSAVTCELGYQVCDARMCLPPQSVTLELE